MIRRMIVPCLLTLVGTMVVACGGEPPTAQIESPANGTAFTTPSVTFVAADSGSDAQYHWDFGDGTATQTTTETRVVHEYSELGTYSISLRVEKGTQESAPTSVSITINDTPPTATLTATPSSGPAPLQVIFSSAGSMDPQGDITEAYDFGDGDRGGPGSTVRHTYQQPGTYTATLFVTDSAGQTTTDSVTITVGDEPRTRLWEVRMVATDAGAFVFDPAVLKINPGDTVEWVNVNQAHSTTAYSVTNGKTPGIPDGGPTWNSGILSNPSQRWSYTFPFDTPPGSYPYFCLPHEFAGQVGIIIVGSFTELDPDFLDSLPGSAGQRMREQIQIARGL